MAESKYLQEIDGYFVKGCDSFSSPDALLQSELVMSMNTVNRGGIIQTRPGTKSLACIGSGNPQGFTFFVPESGVPNLVAVMDGLVYVSAPPFTQFRSLPNIQFSLSSRFVAFADTIQSFDYTSDGESFALDKPYSVLVMQDGLTRAAFWDGGTSRHLNPTVSGQEATLPFRDETKIGLWSAWAGNRLWVSRGNRVFASDIGNPLKFTETQYLAEGRAFYLDSECTGMIETPDRAGLLVFTKEKTYVFQSSILDRTQWLSTDKFQDTALPNIGCVAPRSIVNQYGFPWWFSSFGVTNFNVSARSNISSKISYQDHEMMASKWNIGSDLSGICAASHENYLLMSVPSGDMHNRHTWALDQAVMEGEENSWNGYWTGWRPVQWASGKVGGVQRTFFLSKDYDGYVRVWEAFLGERKDNGCAISCFAQFKEQNFGTLAPKKFIYADVECAEIRGDVGIAGFVGGQKGGWQRVLSKEIVATEGQIRTGTDYSDTVKFAGNRPQTRIIKTSERRELNDCNKCGVESDTPNITDRGFSLLLAWDGVLGIKKYRMFAAPESEQINDGKCETDETGPRTLTEKGCSDTEEIVSGDPLEPFLAGATVTEEDSTGATATASADGESVVSQAAALRRAECRAHLRARAIIDAGIQGIELAWYYSVDTGPGLANTQANQFNSIGGWISRTEWAGGSLHDLFDPISAEENTLLTVDYRCIFLRTLDDIKTWQDGRLYITNQVEGGADIAIGVDPTGPINANAEAQQAYLLASEGVAPTGVSFSTPGSYEEGVLLGDLAPGDCVAIWVRRTATGTEVEGDAAQLVAEGVVE